MPSTRPITALVLGVGGTVNQGIVKALRGSALDCRVLGACISTWSAGLYLCDTAYVSPPAADPRFLAWLFDLCRQEQVDVLLTGVDAILSVIAPRVDELRRGTGTVAVASPPEALAIASDKLATVRWLETRGFAHPRSAASEDSAGLASLLAAVGLPLFAKPRHGRGSQGLLRVDDRADLEYAARRPAYVIQEHLGDPREEFTAGCFCARPGVVLGTIVMRREIECGCTTRAEVVERPDVAAEAAAIAAALGAVGPCNLQLRLRDGRPVCFEINLRFSSTTPMRSRLGFAEVEAAVRLFARGERVDALLKPRPGTVVRYWNEIYVRPGAMDELAASGCLEAPRQRRLAAVEGIDAIPGAGGGEDW